MTQKELAYFEDAVGHEENIIKILSESIKLLEDEKIISFMESEKNEHLSRKESLMNNYLLVLKSTVEVYVHGTLESSNKDSKMLLKQCLNETLDSQEKTYNLMTEYGWYQVNNVEITEIKQVINNINSKK